MGVTKWLGFSHEGQQTASKWTPGGARQPPAPPPPRGLRPTVSWGGSWRPKPRGRPPREWTTPNCVPGATGCRGKLRRVMTVMTQAWAQQKAHPMR